MGEHTPTPKLVMGDIEVIGPDGEPGIPYDEAVIFIEGDEDSEIRVSCRGALRVAPEIVRAVNSYVAPVEALKKIATMPLSKDHEYDEHGEIKHGSRSYSPVWAAHELQRIARAALATLEGK